MSETVENLTQHRDALRKEAEAILERAQSDLTGPDATRFNQLADQLDQMNGRLEYMAADTLRRANATAAVDRIVAGRGDRPRMLTPESSDVARAFRSAIFAKNPAPIEVYASQLADEWPADIPQAQTRCGRIRVHTPPALETRDLLKSTATQALPVDVYNQIIMHMVETSSVMAAGATVVTTDSGEDLQVPKSTAFMTTALTTEGSQITESDPTLGVTTLKAYKYASFFQVSHELANDTPTNLLGFLAQAAGESLALGTGGYGTDLINGNGSGKPTGLLTSVTTGVTGPTGTATSLGTQGTADEGSDALWNLIGSVAEPYSQAPRAAFLMRNASDIIIRKLRDTIGQPVAGLTERGRALGYPCYHDAFMPLMGSGNKPIVFGDFSRFFVRMVNGIRFERSNDYAFQNDLISFRCVVRLDGALVDINAIKAFVNSAT